MASEKKMVSIQGLDKAAVLAALYNASHPAGMGFLQAKYTPMTVEEAQQHLGVGDDHNRMFGDRMNRGCYYFDYLNGRALKVNLSGGEQLPFEPRRRKHSFHAHALGREGGTGRDNGGRTTLRP